MMKYSKKKYIDPSFFVSTIKDYEGNSIDVRMQMDVDEFFINFLDTLEKQLKEVNMHKFLDLCFLGEFYQEIIGVDCNHQTKKIDKFLAISISIKDISRIEKGLMNSIKWEYLEDDNAYYCETCKTKIRAKKRISINHLPNYLIITMKRFEYDMKTG